MPLFILRREDGQTWRDALLNRHDANPEWPEHEVGELLAKAFDAAVLDFKPSGSINHITEDDFAAIAFRIAGEHNLLERVEDAASIPADCDVAVGVAEKQVE